MSRKFLVDENLFLRQQNLPVLIRDRVLLSPGTWNNSKYTPKEIENAYLHTDWHNKSNFSLYLDHQDTENQGAANWVGYVKNIKLKDKGVLQGDLEIWNPMVAIYLNEAKAKFGVSATLKGFEDKENNKMENFKFESFSIVSNPACKEAFINLSQSKTEKGGKMEKLEEVKTEEETEEKSEEELEEETEEESKPEETKENAEDEDEDEEKKDEDLAKKKKEYPYPEKEKMKKKKPEEEDEEELGESFIEMLSMMDKKELSAYTDFVKKMRKKYPKISFKDIAKAWKKQKKMSENLEELNDTELLEQIEERYEVLKRRKKYPEEEETAENKLAKLQETVKKLQEKLNEPDRKTLKTTPVKEGLATSDPYAGMAEFLEQGGSGTFSIK